MKLPLLRVISVGLLSLLLTSCVSRVDWVEQEANAAALNLVGSRWQISYTNQFFGHREYDIIFQPRGRLESMHPNENSPDDDHWELAGRGIILSFNDRYAVYVGDFIDDDHLSGTARSDSGGSWNWSASRKGP